MTPTTPPRPATDPQEWAVLFYLCGHFNRPGEVDPFVAALDDICAAGGSPHIPAAVYLDLESGARRVAHRPGEPAELEAIGATNSGDPQTLEQFLGWAFDACPARQYVLVMAGLGILDADSVVGRPPFDSGRTFAICDDRATDDAIELHELSRTLRAAFRPEGTRRLALLACDMYAMQFLEVAYELRDVAAFLVGIQPDEREDAPPLRHWPYARLLQRWRDVIEQTPREGRRFRFASDPRDRALAGATIDMLGEHYGEGTSSDPPVTVSAVDLRALGALAQALDTFSVVYLQWLSNDVIWLAREQVVLKHLPTLTRAWSYDIDQLACATEAALEEASREALVRWAYITIPTLPFPRLSRALRVLGTAARELARREGSETYRGLADEIARCRSAIERLIAASLAENRATSGPLPENPLPAVRALFAKVGTADSLREPEAWSAIITLARARLTATHASELQDVLDGIEAAKQIAGLARRVSALARGADPGDPSVVAAVWPPGRRSGLSLYRPLDLDKLAESNYLELRFSRELHWTALLTAVDLINNHARMLWRLVESQLTAAPLEARYQLMRRLAGARALTGRHADQLRALSAPEALFLTLEPAEEEPATPAAADDPVASYCVRLSSLDRSSTVLERRNPITRNRLDRVLRELDEIGRTPGQDPTRTLERLAQCGSLLGDDILYGISQQLAAIEPANGRPVHLVLQMPRDLMRYPWELLRDRSGWLVERFAIGRQVIADADSVPRWTASRRQGPLRLLVVAPSIPSSGAELAGAGVLEGEHVAACFERLQERLPGVVEELPFREFIDQTVTVEQFRTLLRQGRYDVVHFAGHGRYDSARPERSCWIFSDGPLYAFELRHTLSNAEVIPWLLYGSACEGAREGAAPSRGYHDGMYGMAGAALGHGVAAYIAPLWKIPDADAKNVAAAFYHALLLRRTSIGEALSLARRLVKEGRLDFDDVVTPVVPEEGAAGVVRSAGWTGIVLYGDPTPTILQRLSPSDTATPEAAQPSAPRAIGSDAALGETADV